MLVVLQLSLSQVSTNGIEFTEAIPFAYIACPPGYLCQDNVALPCPHGAKCDAFGTGNFSLCPPGTYQPAVASTSCLACSVGHYCPEVRRTRMVSQLECPATGEYSIHVQVGMRSPAPCPCGMVCDEVGLQFPNVLCPAGHYCLEGTSSQNPIDLDTNNRPRECPENTWCSEGVTSNISLPGNTSTPQPCLLGFVCFRGSRTPRGSGPCPKSYFCPPGSLPVRQIWV